MLSESFKLQAPVDLLVGREIHKVWLQIPSFVMKFRNPFCLLQEKIPVCRRKNYIVREHFGFSSLCKTDGEIFHRNIQCFDSLKRNTYRKLETLNILFNFFNKKWL
jgi:hypothetical protein